MKAHQLKTGPEQFDAIASGASSSKGEPFDEWPGWAEAQQGPRGAKVFAEAPGAHGEVQGAIGAEDGDIRVKAHQLKTDPEQFDAIARGVKRFEFRLDDRAFQVGDVLDLRKARYRSDTGLPFIEADRLCVRVTHLLRGPAYGVPPGYVVMSIEGAR